MSDSETNNGGGEGPAASPSRERRTRRRLVAFAIVVVIVAIASALVTALLINIFQRKQEAKNPYLKLVEVTEETTDPAPWGMNWARQYDGYRRTADVSRTQY